MHMPTLDEIGFFRAGSFVQQMTWHCVHSVYSREFKVAGDVISQNRRHPSVLLSIHL